jgi:hypothetical protein
MAKPFVLGAAGELAQAFLSYAPSTKVPRLSESILRQLEIQSVTNWFRPIFVPVR